MSWGTRRRIEDEVNQCSARRMEMEATRAEVSWVSRPAGGGQSRARRPYPRRVLSLTLSIEKACARLAGAKTATVHTDGACAPNPGPGGWGLTIAVPGMAVVELAGGDVDTTNNRMEALAAITALRVLPTSCEATIYCDSAYVIKGASEWLAGWRAKRFLRGGRPMPNADLWQDLDALAEGRAIEWRWVRGHNGNAGNERADRLAAGGLQLAIRNARKGVAA
jgi:ribonuclease HI